MEKLKQFRHQTSTMMYTPEEVKQIDIMIDFVNKATDEMRSDEDWAAIMELVDAVNARTSPIILKETVRALRKRLESNNIRVVLTCLTVCEALVKNCGRGLHREISTDKFLGQFQKLHKIHSNRGGRDSLEVSDRILELIQAWGEAFLPFKRDLPQFSNVYHNMRKKGIKFPQQYDETRAPVLTPPSHQEISSTGGDHSDFHGLNNEEIIRLTQNVVEMLEDMLEGTSGKLDENSIVGELAAQCKRLKPKVIEVIEEAAASDNDNLVSYLSLNDSLQAVIEQYDEAMTKDSKRSVSEDIVIEEKKIDDHQVSESIDENIIDFFQNEPNSNSLGTVNNIEVPRNNRAVSSVEHLSQKKEISNRRRAKSQAISNGVIPAVKPPRKYTPIKLPPPRSNQQLSVTTKENISNLTDKFDSMSSQSSKIPSNVDKTIPHKTNSSKDLATDTNGMDDDPFDDFVKTRVSSITAVPTEEENLFDGFVASRSSGKQIDTPSTSQLFGFEDTSKSENSHPVENVFANTSTTSQPGVPQMTSFSDAFDTQSTQQFPTDPFTTTSFVTSNGISADASTSAQSSSLLTSSDPFEHFGTMQPTQSAFSQSSDPFAPLSTADSVPSSVSGSNPFDSPPKSSMSLPNSALNSSSNSVFPPSNTPNLGLNPFDSPTGRPLTMESSQSKDILNMPPVSIPPPIQNQSKKEVHNDPFADLLG